jgi:hypothetical protein
LLWGGVKSPLSTLLQLLASNPESLQNSLRVNPAAILLVWIKFEKVVFMMYGAVWYKFTTFINKNKFFALYLLFIMTYLDKINYNCRCLTN